MSDSDEFETYHPTPPDEDSVGLSNPTLSEGRRRMLDLINRLQNTGVQADIDLPQIAVIGSQSAGKSSLIESITGITLPRAAGTCTRCPTESKLSYSKEPWKCVVSLKLTTNAHGQPLGEVLNIPFGKPIFDRAEVEDRIRRAQLAILHPTTGHEHFLHNTFDGPTQLSFSANSVCLQISGPDVADLSFVDLPGLIASVGKDGRDSDIGLVEGLISSYISKPSCVILLAVSCETDFENQGAHRLAQKYDPEGMRTVGVLTKPDRIPPSEEHRWFNFIRNDAEPLYHNWYCVKQPDSKALKTGVTWKEARKLEDTFFSQTSPWCDELEMEYRRYLRTSNLLECLSKILSDLIAKRLPEIQEEIQHHIMKVEDTLVELPQEPADDAFSEVLGLLHKFIDDVNRHLEGVPEDDGLIQRLHPLHEEFRKTIRMTAPNFVPLERSKETSQPALPPMSFLESEEDSPAADAKGSSISSILSQKVNHRAKSLAPPIHIDEVLDRANNARTRELPGNFPFVIQVYYIKSVTRHWQNPAMKLCQEINSKLLEHSKKLVGKHFAAVGQGHLESRVRFIITEHIKKCYESAVSKIKWLSDIEQNTNFTLNRHYLHSYKEQFFGYYKGVRNTANNSGRSSFALDPVTGKLTTAAVAVSSAIGFQVTDDDLMKLLPTDPMEPALNIMADVRAYFQVAYKRFADNVPLAIDVELVTGSKNGLMNALNTGLEITTKDKKKDVHAICREYTKENERVSDQRSELKRKLARLQQASQELNSHM